MNETPAPFVLPTNVTNVEDHRILFSSASLFSPSLHNDRVSIRTSTGRQHYRLYAIHKIPSLKVLDFTKIKQSERERAQRLAASAAGAAMEADARLEARAAAAATATTDNNGASLALYANGENGTNTFEPGEGKSAEESFATQFTLEEKAQIRNMVANAASAEEIDRIEGLVKRGIFPGSNDGGSSIPPPPPPPPQEDGEGKRTADGGDEGGDSKRQKSE